MNRGDFAAAKEVYLARMKAFGQAGHATDYTPMTLNDMKYIYASGGSLATA